MAGLFVTLEGPDGAGKSTQMELLRRALAPHDPLVVREPGGTTLGESVRELLLHRDGVAMVPEAEMYLFMAARAELIAERIKPALEAGRLVLADRYHDSTLVYQGVVGGAPAAWPASFPRPDLTVLLLIPPEQGLQRQAAARKRPDRMEARPLEFHREVVEGYRTLARADPDRFLVIDAMRPAATITGEIVTRVERLIAHASRGG